MFEKIPEQLKSKALQVLSFSNLSSWKKRLGAYLVFTKHLEHISSKVWENCRGLESGPERGCTGSIIELAMAKQVYPKIDHFTTWPVRVVQKFWQF